MKFRGYEVQPQKIIFILAGCWLFGIGFRMITQFILNPGSIYPAQTPENFDFWFDWLPQVPLGIYILYWGFKTKFFKINETKNINS